jgi:hypothetical protein
MEELSDVPAGVTLSPIARQTHAALKKFTAFPWAILSTQCKRAGIDPATMTADELSRLAPQIAAGVARFTTPAHDTMVRVALSKIVHRL